MPHLRLSSGDGPLEVFALRAARVVLGRSHECDLILPDVVLSRRHAEIVREGDSWRVRDLGSLNGTRLNGTRLLAEALPLRDGDVVAVSDWRIVFRDGDAPSDPALAPGGARLRDVTDLATRSDIDALALARQSRVLAVLTRAAADVVAAPTVESLLDTLLGRLLEAAPARRALVALLEGEPPSPVLAAARAVEGEAPSAVDAAVAERLVRSGQAFFAPRVASEDGTVRSLLCAPLWFTGGGPSTEHVAGCVALEAAADPSPFEEEHLRLVTAVANLAASRLESLRLREETADMRRMEEDLRGAARIQASLLPEEIPAVPGWELAGSTRLCSEVGADYYDFVREDGGLLLALGDVAGKGLAAALLMASLRAAVRARWRDEESLSRVLHAVNASLLQTVPENRFATLFLARLDSASGELRWVNAAHAGPLLVRAGGLPEPLSATGTILGVFDEATWEERRTVLAPGDVLVVLSDGVVEATRAASADLSPERVSALVRSTPGSASALLAALQAAADEGLGGARAADDHTFVVLRRPPSQ